MHTLTTEQLENIKNDGVRAAECAAAPLHVTEHGWTTYCVETPSNTFPNHHFTASGLIGHRVTPDTATHATIVEVGDDGKILSVETKRL